MNKVKDAFTKNILLKVISVIFAILVWLLVVNIDNPSQSRNFTTSVEVINANVLTDNGRYYTIPEGQNTVTFRVTAARNIIERLSPNDFLAIADMNNLEDDSRIPIEITAKNHANALTISSQLRYLTVEVGEEMNNKFVIAANITGEPASGFVVDATEVTPNVISVSGPDKIVNSIKEVKVDCDISGMSSNISENLIPIFVDGNGERVDTTKLALSVSEVTVSVMLTNFKEVPIALEDATVSRDDGISIDTIEITPPKVFIRGSSAIINDITQITIPSTVVDVESITEDVETTVDITQYLPDSVRLMDESQAEVRIQIRLATVIEKQMEISTSDISVRNLDSSKKIEFEESSVTITVRGLETNLESLDISEITGSIDVSGLSNGEHTVRFVADTDPRYSVNPLTLKIIISDADGG